MKKSTKIIVIVSSVVIIGALVYYYLKTSESGQVAPYTFDGSNYEGEGGCNCSK